MHSEHLACFCALVLGCHYAGAQTTAFTYQGRLTDGGSPANGLYDLRFTLYGSGGSPLAGPLTNATTSLTNGLFTVTLDFGNQFPGADRWLEIGARTNGATTFVTLAPRQPLTPTPYALFAQNATLGGTYGSVVNFNNGADSFDGSFYGQFFGSSFIGGSFVGNFIGSGSGLGDVWHTTGNLGTTAGVNFLGTTDNQPLELKAAAQRGLRLEPNTAAGSPNLIGGSVANSVDSGILGATIAGGGSSANPNRVGAIYGTIAGGRNNYVAADHSAIGGGHDNSIGVAAYDSVIAGGASDVIQANATESVISGGNFNTIQGGAAWSILGGGYGNTVNSNATYAVLGGGSFNGIGTNSSSATLSGGVGNQIGANFAGATIGGGAYNAVKAIYGTVPGGRNNTVGADHGSIGGGHDNTIGALAYDAVIAGGSGHTIQSNAAGAVIGGGQNNTVGAILAAVCSGQFAQIGSGSTYAVIVGGSSQTIQGNAFGAALVGGEHNTILSNANWAVIGGGAGNSNASSASVIGGGLYNTIQTNAGVDTISGGSYNVIGTNALYATIPGGFSNSAAGSYALAAGHRAKANHTGAFVWADSQEADFASAATNQFLIRAGGGVGIGTASAPPGGLRVHTGGLAVTGASSPNYGTNGGVYLEWGGTQGNIFAFDYGPFLPKPLVLNAPGSFVGVGRTPTANALEVEGNASKTVAGSWAANSDARIKQDIQPVSGALETLERVRLVSFRYTADYRRAHPSVGDRRYVNVVAQEFREVFPDEVKASGEKLPDGSGEILQVDTHPLTIYSAAAVQELNQKLTAEMQAKEAELAELRKSVNELKAALQALSQKRAE